MIEFQTLPDILRKARLNLNRTRLDQIAGGTETETTIRRNRAALDAVALRPRVGNKTDGVPVRVTHFGRMLRLPVLLAPVGSLAEYGEGGGLTAACAARDFGIGQVLSSVCSPGLEAIADATPGALRILQLYVLDDDDYLKEHIRRAVDKGYSAICITVDNAVSTRRERDLANRYVAGPMRQSRGGAEYGSAVTWRTVEFVRGFDMPLIIKGIVTLEDAEMAVQCGAEWIYVSNHGGRYLDHGRGTVEVLPEVVDAVRGRAKVIVDGGMYRGADVVKAIALGADLVGLGRLQCYALAAGGRGAIVRMLELLEEEMLDCLIGLGAAAFNQLDRSYVERADPVGWSFVGRGAQDTS